jgi:hypothetical protein
MHLERKIPRTPHYDFEIRGCERFSEKTSAT